MNKKQVLKITVFIVIIIWLLIHITYVIRTNGDVKDRFVGFYSEKKDTIDVVMIGSSPVYPSVCNPMLYGDLGLTMYPISSNMQRPVATKYLVEEVLKTQTPDLFIFEMRMWTAEDENLLGNMAHTREVTDNMKYSINRIKTINAMVDDPEERLSYYFDIFKYHSNWKTMILPSQLRTFMYEYPDEYKGYVPLMELGPVEKTDNASITEREAMPAEQEEYLLDLLEYLKDKGINALFVIVPYDVKEDEQKKINYISDIIASNGYDFVDMNQYVDEIGIDYSMDFNDYGTHTNVLGSYKITKWFEEYLKTSYIDTGIISGEDHRNDADYSSWNDAYQLWLEAYEQGKEQIEYNAANEIYYQLDEE